MVHETIRRFEDTGTTAMCGHSLVQARDRSQRGGAPVKSGGIFRLQMATSLFEGGGERLDCKASPWPASQAYEWLPTTFANHSFERCLGLRLSQRFVDAEAHWASHSTGIWGALSPLSCMEAIAPKEMELSGARAPRLATRRQSHRPLETLQVAGYKKKSKDLVPTLFSSTRAAFCSFQRVGEPGVLKERPPSFSTFTNMIVFPLWPPSAYRHGANAWDFTSDFSKTTLERQTWSIFCECSCTSSVETSFFFGIMDGYTWERRWWPCARHTQGYTSSGFPDMPPNSIPSNKYGTISKGIQPIAFRSTSRTSAIACIATLAEPNVPCKNFVPTFCLQNFRRHPGRRCFTYAKLNS